MLMHQIEALLEAGVTQVVLAVSYRAEQMESELRAETAKVGCDVITLELSIILWLCRWASLCHSRTNRNPWAQPGHWP